MAIKGMTTSLQWLSDLLMMFQTEVIKIPKQYREQVVQTKKLLLSDTSGLINSVLDFGINCALVDYTIETNNANLTEELNKWLENINSVYRGRLPVGIDALAKEYFRERWKGASNLVLRTFWENKDGLTLPTRMFFVDGEDIITERKDEQKVTLGDEKYYIRIDSSRENNIAIPANKDELLFVQRPYDYWGVLHPVPYLIRRGLFRNLKFLTLMSEKGEYIVGRALEYLFLIKKGTENMALTNRPEMVYSAEDLKKITTEFGALLKDKKNATGTPTYATNFDTDLQHLIPDYKMAINETIYAPMERRILAGLGLVDIITGTSSNRRETILNPKPFISEIKQGIEDFKILITDILKTVEEKNSTRKKYFGGKSVRIKVNSGPVEHFIDDKIRNHIRSMYDRGTISIETYNSIVGGGNINHGVEKNRRTIESKNKDEELFYPHLIDNREGVGKDIPGQKKSIEENPDIPKNPKGTKAPDKIGPEKKNFKGSLEEGKVHNLKGQNKDKNNKTAYGALGSDQFKTKDEAEDRAAVLKCEGTHTHKDEDGNKVFMPCSTHAIWEDRSTEEAKIIGQPVDPRKPTFKKADLEEYLDDYEESKIVKRKEGYHVVSKEGKNLGGPFKTRKEALKRLRQVEHFKGRLESSGDDLDIDELVEIKKLEILGKQNKLLDQILKESTDNENS